MKVNGYEIKPKADLSGANLTRANLTRAVANEANRWPKGFDPVAAGVTFE